MQKIWLITPSNWYGSFSLVLTNFAKVICSKNKKKRTIPFQEASDYIQKIMGCKQISFSIFNSIFSIHHQFHFYFDLINFCFHHNYNHFHSVSLLRPFITDLMICNKGVHAIKIVLSTRTMSQMKAVTSVSGEATLKQCKHVLTVFISESNF